jgi:hypothetical protein
MRTIDETRLSGLMTPHPHGHALSRRRLLQAGVATTAMLAASSALSPLRAAAASGTGGGTPVPVPANPAFGGLHIYSVALGSEPSSVGDFNGVVGAAIIDGTGVGRSASGATEQLLFDTDMRFMQGTFRGTDGLAHEGTFAFV